MKENYIYDGKEWTKDQLLKIFKELQDHPLPTRALSTLSLIEGEVILDVGCGVGFFSRAIAKKAKKVVAIDILESSIEIARDFNSVNNIEYIPGDLFALNFPNNTFDCIIFLETIEHVDNPTQFLQEFYRILKPDGYLILSTPNALSYTNIVSCLAVLKKSQAEKIACEINDELRNTGTQTDHIYTWDFTTLYGY